MSNTQMTPFTPRGRDHDRISRESVGRWMEAVGAPAYLLVLRQEETDRVVRRLWSPETIEGATGWLRHMNSCGWSVMGRPWCGGRHVVVDDLNTVTLGRLAAAYAPSAVVESSPGSYQAWITISTTPLGAETAGAVARYLARRFGGDTGATAWNQPGRVPAFTCRKAARRRADQTYPFARLISADGPMVTPQAGELLEAAAGSGSGAAPSMPAVLQAQPGRRRLLPRTPAEEMAEGGRRIHDGLPAGATVDRSACDFAIARRLACRGAPPDYIADVLAMGDRAGGLPPDVAEDYIRRTVSAAMRAASRQDDEEGDL